jgi:hypothetical protein
VTPAARRTTDRETLYALIAEALPSPDERNAFLANRSKRAAPAQQGTIAATRTSLSRAGTKLGTRTSLSGVQVTPEVVDEAARALTPFLGPIAKVVVKRAAAVAQDRQVFYQLLADELPTEQDRSSFLRAVGAVI